ncbi:helix-turn-helix domain-containing protein [Tateyamaria sp.]|uniref:helix-turn-helix domain-containing protein n=2 Tax=Tateyamaria sp. TaxID=1929288 RepID=UPI0032A05EC3
MAPSKQIPDASLAMIKRLSTRVRAARLALGMPRRELSIRSGVSPRYLAQLEAGEGNISVLLLHRVAIALNVTVEDLLAERAPLDRDLVGVAQLFNAAPTPVQGRVRALLAPHKPSP